MLTEYCNEVAFTVLIVQSNMCPVVSPVTEYLGKWNPESKQCFGFRLGIEDGEMSSFLFTYPACLEPVPGFSMEFVVA
jgi:hypothetical protein